MHHAHLGHLSLSASKHWELWHVQEMASHLDLFQRGRHLSLLFFIVILHRSAYWFVLILPDSEKLGHSCDTNTLRKPCQSIQGSRNQLHRGQIMPSWIHWSRCPLRQVLSSRCPDHQYQVRSRCKVFGVVPLKIQPQLPPLLTVEQPLRQKLPLIPQPLASILLQVLQFLALVFALIRLWNENCLLGYKFLTEEYQNLHRSMPRPMSPNEVFQRQEKPYRRCYGYKIGSISNQTEWMPHHLAWHWLRLIHSLRSLWAHDLMAAK